MRLILTAILAAAIAFAAPVPESGTDSVPTTTIESSSTPSATIATSLQAYTAAINPTSSSEPPPLWDPPSAPPPPLFEAPAEDLPHVPLSLVSVHEAPVQLVRLERISPFTGSSQQPVDNIYRASPQDPEAGFKGQGSLRPATRTLLENAAAFVRAWIWWISVVLIAAVLVYVAEKMLVGAVKGARRARSVSRVARSRAVSLVAETRSRATSLVRGASGPAGRTRSLTVGKWGEPRAKLERSRSPPPRTRSREGSMV